MIRAGATRETLSLFLLLSSELVPLIYSDNVTLPRGETLWQSESDWSADRQRKRWNSDKKTKEKTYDTEIENFDRITNEASKRTRLGTRWMEGKGREVQGITTKLIVIETNTKTVRSKEKVKEDKEAGAEEGVTKSSFKCARFPDQRKERNGSEKPKVGDEGNKRTSQRYDNEVRRRRSRGKGERSGASGWSDGRFRTDSAERKKTEVRGSPKGREEHEKIGITITSCSCVRTFRSSLFVGFPRCFSVLTPQIVTASTAGSTQMDWWRSKAPHPPCLSPCTVT